MLKYALDASEMEDPFEQDKELDPEVLEADGIVLCVCAACAWLQQERSPEGWIQEREEMISQLVLSSEEIRLSGKGAQWFWNSDEIIKKVTEGVNGFFLEELLIASHYRDIAAVELFRRGESRVFSQFCLYAAPRMFC